MTTYLTLDGSGILHMASCPGRVRGYAFSLAHNEELIGFLGYRYEGMCPRCIGGEEGNRGIMTETQRQIVERLLLSRGELGMTAYEAIYSYGITRLATYVYDLRQEGGQIRSATKRGETARYWLVEPPPGHESRYKQTELFSA